MKITKENRLLLNKLLQDPTIDLPDIRREVSESGMNVEWLRKQFVRNNGGHAKAGEVLSALGVKERKQPLPSISMEGQGEVAQ